jgi:hypothetical protein
MADGDSAYATRTRYIAVTRKQTKRGHRAADLRFFPAALSGPLKPPSETSGRLPTDETSTQIELNPTADEPLDECIRKFCISRPEDDIVSIYKLTPDSDGNTIVTWYQCYTYQRGRMPSKARQAWGYWNWKRKVTPLDPYIVYADETKRTAYLHKATEKTKQQRKKDKIKEELKFLMAIH